MDELIQRLVARKRGEPGSRYGDDEYTRGFNNGLNEAIMIARSLEKKGMPKPYRRGGWLCPNCDKVIEVGGAHYCWNCGTQLIWGSVRGKRAEIA